jgi:hypothetical protein
MGRREERYKTHKTRLDAWKKRRTEAAEAEEPEKGKDLGQTDSIAEEKQPAHEEELLGVDIEEPEHLARPSRTIETCATTEEAEKRFIADQFEHLTGVKPRAQEGIFVSSQEPTRLEQSLAVAATKRDWAKLDRWRRASNRARRLAGQKLDHELPSVYSISEPSFTTAGYLEGQKRADPVLAEHGSLEEVAQAGKEAVFAREFEREAERRKKFDLKRARKIAEGIPEEELPDREGKDDPTRGHTWGWHRIIPVKERIAAYTEHYRKEKEIEVRRKRARSGLTTEEQAKRQSTWEALSAFSTSIGEVLGNLGSLRLVRSIGALAQRLREVDQEEKQQRENFLKRSRASDTELLPSGEKATHGRRNSL